MSSFNVSEIFPSACVQVSFVSDYGALFYSLGAFSCCGEKAAVQQTIICESSSPACSPSSTGGWVILWEWSTGKLQRRFVPAGLVTVDIEPAARQWNLPTVPFCAFSARATHTQTHKPPNLRLTSWDQLLSDSVSENCIRCWLSRSVLQTHPSLITQQPHWQMHIAYTLETYTVLPLAHPLLHTSDLSKQSGLLLF